MTDSRFKCQPKLEERSKKFYGKYRGKVVDNSDLKGLGRIRAEVPDVSDEPLTWAMPCLPLGGNGTGIFTVPPVGSGVWIEFEHGDPDYPIWVGCYWRDQGEVPAPARGLPQVSSITLQTVDQNFIIISDKSGIKLQSKNGASISINNNEIKIENGQGASIELRGNSVKINQGALEVQ
jgi:uncharacterized protein involved in type VI secretion and phage assembly